MTRIQKHLKPQRLFASTAVAFVRRAWQQEDLKEWLVKNTLGVAEHLEDWASIVVLIGSHYWSRIWIIQELGLAASLTVYCGQATIEWDALCLVHRIWHDFSRSMATTTNPVLWTWFIKVQRHSTHLFNRLGMKVTDDGLLYLLHPSMVGPLFIERNIRNPGKVGQNLMLLDLLASSFTSFATNPRDKIYGLLGLVNDEIGRTYEVDYMATERKSLQYLVRHAIETTKRLDVLCYASFHKGLPTWVPYWGPFPITDMTNFSLFLPSTPIFWRKLPLRFPGQERLHSFAPLRHRDLDAFLRRFAIDKKFAAAGSTEADAYIEEKAGGQPVLVAAGCVVDEIAKFLNPFKDLSRKRIPGLVRGATSAGEATTEFDDFLMTPSAWLSNGPDIIISDRLKIMLKQYLCTSSPLTGDPKILAFVQAITYDRTSSGDIGGSKYWAPFQALLRNDLDTATFAADLRNKGPQKLRADIGELLYRVREVFEVPIGDTSWKTRRKLYVTKRGAIGLGEPHAREGDLVCVLKGCFRPILVKRRTRVREEGVAGESVVSEASHGCTYLHGYMEGKAIEEMESGVREGCTFILQ